MAGAKWRDSFERIKNMTDKAPQGIVAILVSKDGTQITNASDFNLSTPGGFERQEAQRIRAKASLAMKAVRELSSPILSDSVERYEAEQILDRMCKNGCRVIFVPIGYEE